MNALSVRALASRLDIGAPSTGTRTTSRNCSTRWQPRSCAYARVLRSAGPSTTAANSDSNGISASSSPCYPAVLFGHRLQCRERRCCQGQSADVVVFDPERCSDAAAHRARLSYAVGTVHVLVAGRFALREDTLSPDRHGRALRRRTARRSGRAIRAGATPTTPR